MGVIHLLQGAQHTSQFLVIVGIGELIMASILTYGIIKVCITNYVISFEFICYFHPQSTHNLSFFFFKKYLLKILEEGMENN